MYNDAIQCRICKQLIFMEEELRTFSTHYREYRITIYMHDGCKKMITETDFDRVIRASQWDAILTDDDLPEHQC